MKITFHFFALIFFSVMPVISFAQTFDWVKHAGDNNNYNNYGTSVAIDHSGNVVATGIYSDSCIYETLTLINTGVTGIFLAKYDDDGNLSWVKTIDGDSHEQAAGVAIDQDNNIFVTGSFRSRTIHFTLSDSISNSSSYDGWNCFVAKYNTSGNLQWVRCIKSPYDAKTISITADENGNVIIGGNYTNSVYLADTSLSGGAQNIFLAKYSSSGDLLWVHAGKSNSTCLPQALSTDVEGNIYATGKLSGDIAFNAQTLGTIIDQQFNTASIPANFYSSLPNAFLNFTPYGIQVYGGVNNFYNYLYYAYYSNLENFKLESNAKVITTGEGLGLGKYAGAYVLANFPLTVSDTNKILLYNYFGTIGVSSSYSIAINDSINISLQRSYDTVSATLINYTQHYSVTVGYRHLVGLPYINTIMPNNGFYSLVFLGGIQTVFNYTLSSMENRNALCAFAGNSITTGYSCGGKGYRYSDVLYNNSPYLYAVNAGAGDLLLHVLYDTTEMINLNPKYVFVNIGVNDAFANIDTLLFQNDYSQLVHTYKQHGIIPVLATLTPQGSTLVHPYNRRIEAVAIADTLTLVPIYDSLVDDATGYMKFVYNSGDYVHPNALGNIKMSEAIAAEAPFLLSDITTWCDEHSVTQLPAGNDKVFLSKYNSDGELLWLKIDTSTTANGSTADNNFSCGNGIAVDNAGNIFTGGNFLAANYEINGNTIILQDAFVEKHSNDGNPLWQKRWGSGERVGVKGLAINSTNKPYVAGNYNGYFAIDGSPLPAADYCNLFIAKFDASGNNIWFAASSGHAIYGNAIAVDMNDSSVAATGCFNNSATFGNIEVTSPLAPSFLNYDIFVTQLSDNDTSIPQLGDFNEFTIYPTPASDYINISFANEDEYKIVVSDVIGKELKSIATTDKRLGIDISLFTAGMYFITVSDQQRNLYSGKFVKM